ncbi:hypothetical protein O9K51_02012 [Purpureocillium lavendulum]|uniref:Secreted protein n=1 Tax=Purpureocillium lavendulum TaxID=1247861 RepID=A0AB34G6M9_9HYPO|nr:hypothetical protein O9K51_02012 [Purpureocillium lavendulum]
MTTLSMRASSLTVLTVISTLNSLASAAMHSPFRRARGWTRLVESVCVVECINEDPSGRLYRLPLPNKYCIPPHIMCKGGEYVIEESVPKAERAEREARCRCSDWHLKVRTP